MHMENYKFIEKIGRGTHGTVYLLKSHEEDKYVVCKSVIEKHFKHANREISILHKLNHRRVVRILDNIQIKNSIFIILEYANYGTLDSMISYFSKNKIKPNMTLVWSIISQISDALYFIHSKKIIHRDIKPANILINKFFVKNSEYLEFKICDFSLSTSFENYHECIEDGTTVGTPFYMSPEMVSKNKYNPSIDVWGMGVSLYELINLQKPFAGSNRDELYKEILTKHIKLEEICSDLPLANLIYKCLDKKNRISAKDIAKNEKVRLNLTMLELKYREGKIEILESKIKEFEKLDPCIKDINKL